MPRNSTPVVWSPSLPVQLYNAGRRGTLGWPCRVQPATPCTVELKQGRVVSFPGHRGSWQLGGRCFPFRILEPQVRPWPFRGERAPRTEPSRFTAMALRSASHGDLQTEDRGLLPQFQDSGTVEGRVLCPRASRLKPPWPHLRCLISIVGWDWLCWVPVTSTVIHSSDTRMFVFCMTLSLLTLSVKLDEGVVGRLGLRSCALLP